jgi:hypothetical protein
MKHTRIITTVLSQLRLPESLLEDIVNHRTRTTKYNYPVSRIEKELYCADIDTISTYTIQTCVKGNLLFECYNNESAAVEIIHVPVASSFLVTCAKAKEHSFKVEFCSSLN